MSGKSSTSSKSHGIIPSAAVALRRLSTLLRSGGGISDLFAAVADVLVKVPGFEDVGLIQASANTKFEASRLTIPLAGSTETIGLMRVGAGASGEFSPGNMQFAGAVADLTAVVLEQALQAHGFGSSAEILSVALGDLSLGVMCFDQDGKLFFSNQAARDLLEGEVPAAWNAVWTALAPPERKNTGTPFVRRSGGRLVHVMARRAPDNGPGAVILDDLTPRVVAFGESVAGEVYRRMIESSRLALGVISGPEGSPAALALLDSALADLPAGARFGPVDAEAVGVVVPGFEAGAMWRLLRNLGRLTEERMRGGVATLRSGQDTPEALHARATAVMQPLPAPDVPDLLVFDRSESVTDTLALILRQDFAVTCATQWDRSLELLRDQPFDGVILELPSEEDQNENASVRKAVGLQPLARPFFITDSPGPWELSTLGLPEAPVFRKPFVVRELRAAVRKAFDLEAS